MNLAVTETPSRSWPHRDALPTQRKLAAAFAAVGFPLLRNPGRSFWRLSDVDVVASIRRFQRDCTAARVGLLEPTGKLDDATMATLFHLLTHSPAIAREVFTED